MAFATLLLTACPHIDPDGPVGPDVPVGPDDSWRQQASTTKLSGITYQLNVYSFADSDGDGWGDIRGITQHLDYLDSIGATALWLSPIHESMSYHGYNVNDYFSVSSKLGTESDLQDLISKAKAKNIAIYLDFVLNHSGKDNDWFRQAMAEPSGKYGKYYVFSDKPGESVTGGMGSWCSTTSGNVGYEGRLHFKLDWNKKTVTVTETTSAAQGSNSSASKWLYYGDGKMAGLYETSSGIFEITLDFKSEWGFLVRTSTTSWDSGTKWGGTTGKKIEFGTPYTINSNPAADITFGGESLSYWASFDASMPDLYYGPYAKASESEAFKDMAAAADKWIRMGVAGLRLDAVIWIYQNNTAANVSFLKQWYDRCNSTWKANGGQGDFYMVGESWCDNAEKMAPYYEGLPSNFNFYYGYTLKDRIGKNRGDDFARTVIYFQNLFRGYRSDFIDAIFLSNHDQDRFASDLGRDVAKEKLAAAVLLTSPGKPYVYQGEELGYWGTKSKGDEYVRAPIKWTRSGSVPSTALNGKVDNSMLSADISVEAQEQTQSSVLRVYRDFAKARNGWKALAKGSIEEVTSPNSAVAVWKMSYEGQTVLVIHNFGTGGPVLPLTNYKTDKLIVSNGTVTVSNGAVAMGAYSSAVFLQ
jgi:glycosidase